jgi:DNA-binding FadR family transcriptional regulator
MLLDFIRQPGKSRFLQQLEENLRQAETLRERVARDDGARVPLLSNLHEFHRILAAATNNPVFILAAEAIVAIISGQLSDIGHHGCVSLDSVKEHREILESLRSGRVEEAQKMLEAHLKADSRRTRTLLQQYRRTEASPLVPMHARRRRA